MTMSPSTRPRIERSASVSSSPLELELDTSRWKPFSRDRKSTPWMTSEKNSPCRSGSSSPSVWVRFVIRLRAMPLGQ